MSQLATEVAESSGVPPSSLGEPEVEGKSPGQLFWARFKQDKVAVAGCGVIYLLILIALFGGPLAERISGHDPNDVFKDAFLRSFVAHATKKVDELAAKARRDHTAGKTTPL